jgi:hypothetical protein
MLYVLLVCMKAIGFCSVPGVEPGAMIPATHDARTCEDALKSIASPGEQLPDGVWFECRGIPKDSAPLVNQFPLRASKPKE